jgi:serine/threonine-protein kinase
MQPARVLDILAQCCASLNEAHERSIIHRDMKPDNIFVLGYGGRDHVKVLDFSVAKLLADRGFRTAAGMVFGTPEYMSPEQGRGRDLDARSDIYALGCIAYEMLTGKVPFSDPHNPMAILQAHMTAPPPPLPSHIPQAVQQIVVKSLDKEQGRRFSSAREMQAVCESTLAQLTGQTPGRTTGTLPPDLEHVPRPQGPGPQQHGQQGHARHARAPEPAAAQKTMMASADEIHGPGSGGPPPAQQKAAAKTVFAMESPVAGGAPPPAAPAGGPPPPAAGPPPAAPPVGGPPPAAPPAGGSNAAAQKTLFAPQGAGGGPPPAAGGSAGGSGSIANPAAQKTMFAPQGGAGGPPPMAGAGATPAAGGGGQAKTVMAASASELLKNVQPPPMTGGGPPTMPPAASGQPGGGKTVMLSPSDGVVSFAMGPNAAPPTTGAQGGGASLAFWMICLSLGVAIGAGAYFLMIMVGQ